MEESALLKRVREIEGYNSLYNDTILGIPLWRIVRFHTRLYYITSQTGYISASPTSPMLGESRIHIFSGFNKFKSKHNLSLFFPFNRLVYSNGRYLDKFIDPVISESSLNTDNYVIIDPPRYVGNYDREHKTQTIDNESRSLIQQLLNYYFRCLTPIFYGKAIRHLFSKAQTAFDLPDDFISRYYKLTSLFLAKYYYYLYWFKKIKPRRVFVVYREGYFAQIAACKKLGIPVAEFQHGITLDDTVSFAGEYDQRIDPDYFLVFGDYWKGPQFGMPLDRIVNIGWAYSKYLQKNIAQNAEKHVNEILVISSPEISDNILDALKAISEADGNYSFDIRLHPCESYNEQQKQKLNAIPKAQVVDNKTDSALVLPTYKYVVGENSSVIYEALSVGCKVGMLNLCGLRPAIDLPGIKENFFVINDAKDFEQFLSEDESSSASKAEFYSDFDSEAFMNFIKEKM